MPTLQIPSRVFAAVYDRVSAGAEEAGLSALRRDLIATATGTTVEIGAGTGLNVAHYPTTVDRLVLTEPDGHMRAKLQEKLDGTGLDAEVTADTAEALPFPDGSVDTVVGTMVLCTAPDQQRALTEIRRVLKPGGRLLFLEHVLSERPRIGRLQRAAKPVYSV